MNAHNLTTVREAQGRIWMELDAMSNAKVGSQWHLDRIAELQRLIEQERSLMAK